MSWFYRHAIRPLLFQHDAEAIHDFTLARLEWASRNALVCEAMESFLGAPALPVEVFGLRFPNPVGLAAGMDKMAHAVPAWAALGFGFSELGGVTWQPQPGNPPPRIFRAIAEEAIVNRMGFNNDGAPALATALQRWRESGRWPAHPVGINFGKSKVTPLDKAAEDYANSYRVLRPFADFFVVNVSSPNTPNLRQLQDKAALEEILIALQEVEAAESKKSPGVSGRPGTIPSRKPLLVKVAPDLAFEALDEILALATERQIAGLVATNTTITRPETNHEVTRRVYAEAGGLSGAPLRARSTEVIRHIYRQTRGRLPIIGSGGIFTAADAWEKITAGASLVQIYTGLVYRGPGIARDVVNGLAAQLAAHNARSLSQVIGKLAA